MVIRRGATSLRPRNARVGVADKSQKDHRGRDENKNASIGESEMKIARVAAYSVNPRLTLDILPKKLETAQGFTLVKRINLEGWASLRLRRGGVGRRPIG